MTDFTLSNLKSALKSKPVLLSLFFGLAIALAVVVYFTSRPPAPISYTPIDQQPVIDGKFDADAPISQQSKTSIEKLKPKLPYREEIKTSADQNVTFALLASSIDLYTLSVEIFGIEFQLTYDDPNLAKNVQSFRDTARTIFEWMDKQGVKSNEVFITWGSRASQQISAEAWLNPSPQYPNVVKRGDQYVFEVEPDKSLAPTPTPEEQEEPTP